MVELGEACDDGNTWDDDFCAADCASTNFCTENAPLPTTISSDKLGPLSDYVPLCNYRTLIGQRSPPAVVHYDHAAPKGQNILATYPLAAEPGVMVLDPAHSLLFVAEPSAPQLERIDLSSGVTTTVALPAPAVGLALGEGGLVFARLADPSPPDPAPSLAVVDGVKGSVEAVSVGPFGALLAYDRGGGQLITGELTSGPGALRRFAFDPLTKALTLTQERIDVGADCLDLALSSNGKSIAYACVLGNDGQSNLFDISPSDLSTVGTYPILAAAKGPYPITGVTFTNNGKVLIVTGNNNQSCYSVKNHYQVVNFVVDLSPPSVFDRPRYAPLGAVQYAFVDYKQMPPYQVIGLILAKFIID